MEAGLKGSWTLVGGLGLLGVWAWPGARVSRKRRLSAVFGSSENFRFIHKQLLSEPCMAFPSAAERSLPC